MGTSEKGPELTFEDIQTARRLEWAARYDGLPAYTAAWVGAVVARVGLPDMAPTLNGPVA